MKWTPEEDKILKEHYPTVAWDDLLAMLPGRTRTATRWRARVLGLRRKHLRKGTHGWSPEEVAVLTEKYPNCALREIEAALPTKSRQAIYSKAFSLRLRKAKRAREAPEKRICPDCGGPKSSASKRCYDCNIAKIRKVGRGGNQKEKRPVKPVSPILFRQWEKQVLVELGPRVSMTELRMLLPRRSIREIRRMAEAFDIKLL